MGARPLLWLTDPHLDHCEESVFERLLDAIRLHAPEAVLISGDIADARTLHATLERLEAGIEAPIYFVLGNHDHYGGSIVVVRERLARFIETRPRLHWLARRGAIELAPDLALLGHGGWGDARAGNLATPVRLNDHRLIAELSDLEQEALHARLQALGDEAARHLEAALPQALDRCRRVIVLTHVPPFAQACRYAGGPGQPDWLPYFVCETLGRVLLRAAEAAPEATFLVLCGHTHEPARVRVRPNLHVWCGGAQYGAPRIEALIEVEPSGVDGSWPRARNAPLAPLARETKTMLEARGDR